MSANTTPQWDGSAEVGQDTNQDGAGSKHWLSYMDEGESKLRVSTSVPTAAAFPTTAGCV
jgi:hypothetical protein